MRPAQHGSFEVTAWRSNVTTDVPGLMIDQLLDAGLKVQRRTYAACARAMLEDIKPGRQATGSPRSLPAGLAEHRDGLAAVPFHRLL